MRAGRLHEAERRREPGRQRAMVAVLTERRSQVASRSRSFPRLAHVRPDVALSEIGSPTRMTRIAVLEPEQHPAPECPLS